MPPYYTLMLRSLASFEGELLHAFNSVNLLENFTLNILDHRTLAFVYLWIFKTIGDLQEGFFLMELQC